MVGLFWELHEASSQGAHAAARVHHACGPRGCSVNVEWLWEILRYRRLKKRILDVHRAASIDAILQRLDGEGIPAEAMPLVRTQARRPATEWRDDPEAALEIEARLDRSGFDPIAIDAEVFVQAQELFLMFDQLCSRRKTGVSGCCARSASDVNLPDASGASCLMEEHIFIFVR